MGKSAPSPPAAPNPVDTARASTSTNVATSVANAFLNNTNQITPEGSVQYDPTGSYTWNDPYTGLNVNIPTFTATQTLSPQGQAIQDQSNAAKFNLAGMANAQSARLSDWLANNIDVSNAPSAGDPSMIGNVPAPATSFAQAGQQQTSLGNYGTQTGSFDNSGMANAGNITGTYGAGDFSADRQNVQNALMARINPQLDMQRQQLEQQLSDQGIRYGSQAYDNAMRPFNQQVNDAQFAAINQAGQEQQRMMDMAAQRAGFQNAAQQQAYNQAQGRGQFYNTAQAQQFQEQLGAGQFANAAQQNQFQQAAARGDYYNAGLAQQVSQAQSTFNAQNMARNQYMNEQFALRNQPINEVSSLLSGAQINNPNFVNTPNNQIPTTDVAGLINNRFSQDMSIYQQQSQNYNAQMGGMFGLAGGLLKGGLGLLAMSDRRTKDDIVRVGTVFTTDVDSDEPHKKMASVLKDVDGDEGKKELPIYQYTFKADPMKRRHIGPMAQDVEKTDRGAVVEIGGIKHIKARRLMGNILRAG
jgi:hypothetical protein